MQVDELTRSQTRAEAVEQIKQARRRERALFRAPVKAPTAFAKEEVRRVCAEIDEEFRLRS
jgi:hypothetical protein